MNIKLEDGAINTDHARQFKATTYHEANVQGDHVASYVPKVSVQVIWSDGTEEKIENQDAVNLMYTLSYTSGFHNPDGLTAYFMDVYKDFKRLQEQCGVWNKEMEEERERQYQQNLNEQYENLKGIVGDYFESN